MELYLDIIFATCTGGRDPALKRYKRYFNNDVIITVRNSSCRKVMFLHLSVIMFTGGVCSGTPLGQTSPWEYTPPRAEPPSETATAADGTHPTGMHSCICRRLINTVTIPFHYTGHKSTTEKSQKLRNMIYETKNQVFNHV